MCKLYTTMCMKKITNYQQDILGANFYIWLHSFWLREIFINWECIFFIMGQSFQNCRVKFVWGKSYFILGEIWFFGDIFFSLGQYCVWEILKLYFGGKFFYSGAFLKYMKRQVFLLRVIFLLGQMLEHYLSFFKSNFFNGQRRALELVSYKDKNTMF